MDKFTTEYDRVVSRMISEGRVVTLSSQVSNRIESRIVASSRKMG